MWYLQPDTLLILCIFSLGLACVRKCRNNTYGTWTLRLLPLLEFLFLIYVSWRLALLYVLYLGLGLVCAELLFRCRHAWVFLLCSAAALIPLLLRRSGDLGLTLPFVFVSIGIAYQTLKLIDVYYFVYFMKERVDRTAFVNYMLFLPTFTAGPLFRYQSFVASCRRPVPPASGELVKNFLRIIRGLFKKLVLSAAGLWALEALLAHSAHWYVSVLATLGSYLILYFDLSGYSDIAIAFGRIAGIAVPENFKAPWKAASFTRFWSSWQASLSGWFRDHVFALAGKRRSSYRAVAAMNLLTMVLFALWHGFHPLCLTAGLCLGLLLAAESLLGVTAGQRRDMKMPVYVLRCVIVNGLFALCTLGLLLTPEQVLFVLRGFLKG